MGKILERGITQREPRMRENNLYPFGGDPVRKRNRNPGTGDGRGWETGKGDGGAHVRDRGAE